MWLHRQDFKKNDTERLVTNWEGKIAIKKMMRQQSLSAY